MNISRITRTLIAATMVLSLVPATMAQEKKEEKKAEKKTVRQTIIVKDGKVYKSETDGDLVPFSGMPTVRRGFLGVHLIELTPELRDHYRVAKDAGVLVSKVQADGPAAKAGIKAGDIITAVDGQKVDSQRDISSALREKKNGEAARIEYTRDGVKGVAVASIIERERPEIDVRNFDVRVPDMSHVTEYFNSPEWKAKMERLEKVGDCPKLQNRIQELESRLKELEKKLK